MSIRITPISSGRDGMKDSTVPCGARGRCIGCTAKTIEIGIVNNMPDGALDSTERQFLTLLDLASNGFVVHVTYYSLPGIRRSEAGQRHVSTFYSDVTKLWNRRLDGLIVTGTEPRSSSLEDEPYWASLQQLIRWAEENTRSAIWSCLAAHAAVLELSGIRRQRMAQKLFGVFDCSRAVDHDLLSGLPANALMPHSRWNGLSETELTDCGYQVLTRSTRAGVDSFIRSEKSLFLFLQGHPEYEANTLLLEYRRDVGRYIRNETNVYPGIPNDYFDQESQVVLTALANSAALDRNASVLTDFPTALVERNLKNRWRSTAVPLYTNWLHYLWEAKSAQPQTVHPVHAFQNAVELMPARRIAASAGGM